jgi:hypothetical protein
VTGTPVRPTAKRFRDRRKKQIGTHRDGGRHANDADQSGGHQRTAANAGQANDQTGDEANRGQEKKWAAFKHAAMLGSACAVLTVENGI